MDKLSGVCLQTSQTDTTPHTTLTRTNAGNWAGRQVPGSAQGSGPLRMGAPHLQHQPPQAWAHHTTKASVW